MPSFDIVKKLDVKETYRVARVLSDFDMDKSKGDVHFKGEIEIPEDWSVGLIYGASGTGKTTLVKELFPDAVVDEFSWGGVVFRRFPKGHPVRGNLKDALCRWYGLGAFLGATFSCTFKWRENARHLGAWIAGKRLFVFDEFTSVVDRQVAKVCSLAVSRYCKKHKKKFLAVSCHKDVVEWLEPDFTFCTDDYKQNFPLARTQKQTSLLESAGAKNGQNLAVITI